MVHHDHQTPHECHVKSLLQNIYYKYIKDLFEKKKNRLLLNRSVQPQRRTTTHGLRSISYIGAKIWNNLPLELNSIKDMSIDEFKNLLKTWRGPDINTSLCPYV